MLAAGCSRSDGGSAHTADDGQSVTKRSDRCRMTGKALQCAGLFSFQPLEIRRQFSHHVSGVPGTVRPTIALQSCQNPPETDMRPYRSIILGVILAAAHATLTCQTSVDPRDAFTKVEAMIPMRDGMKLYTEVFTPKGTAEQLPFILRRTPYNAANAARGNLAVYLKDLVDEGYIFVFQDIRGRYRSEGTFVMQRFDRDTTDPRSTDESSDTYDTIEWLLKNIPNNNGSAGILGVSYDGWLSVMAMLRPHPAMRAVSEQATPADMFLGDDFHHNGAFRLSYGLEYAFMMEASSGDTSFAIPSYDTYDWYLRLGPLGNVDKLFFHGSVPTWNDYVKHPDYDEFWKQQALAWRLKEVTVPVMHVAGWWDQEDFYGPLKAYELLEKHDMKGWNVLVAGPWNHGGWSRGTGHQLGNIQFGDSTSAYFRKHVQAQWFAYHLKGKGTGDFPEALTFRTGDNSWQRHESWPPKQHMSDKKLYFRENGLLSFVPPSTTGRNAFDEYVSDPAKPVPYRTRPIEQTYGPGSRWSIWQTEDQRFVHDRPDVLSWWTEPLTDDVTISGEIAALLYASTTGSDADWIVKLIDVYPDMVPEDRKMSGYQLMVAGDVLRGRFRKGFEKPEPVKPNAIETYRVPLLQHDHTFRKGHRIMVHVQSTWFPIIDRNPQSYVPNIFHAREQDFVSARHRIYRTDKMSSHVTLPVVMEDSPAVK